jgi:hypothetical protein
MHPSMTSIVSSENKTLLSKKALFAALMGCFLLLVISIVILASVPPVSRDALTHHLAIPKLYLKHGGIYEIPSIVFSYYPMNLDLLYMLPLYFGNDIAPKLIHFLFALLTAWLLYRYLAKRLGHAWALFGAVFFLSLPIIVKLSITVYVDLGLLFFSTAAILGLLKWIEEHFQIKFLVISAICCGLALGTKYNGLIILFILTIFVAVIYINRTRIPMSNDSSISTRVSIGNQFKAVGHALLFCLIALLVFSPWMIRNYVWKKNPIYPLYDSWFDSQRTSDSASIDDISDNGNDDSNVVKMPKNSPTTWGPFAIRKIIYGESWWEIASIPVRIFFQGKDDTPKYFDGKLSPFLLLLPLFAFYKSGDNANALELKREKTILTAFVVLYLLYAFLQTDMRIRYIAPVIPPLVILATFGLSRIADIIPDRSQKLPPWFSASFVLILAGAVLSLNSLYIVKQFTYVEPFRYLNGELDRNAYILKYRPEFGVIHYANQNLPDNAKILALFLGNRSYYSDRELIFGNNIFKKIVKEADSVDRILGDIQKRGYSHLLVRYDIFNSWAGVQFTDREKEMLKILFEKSIRTVVSENGYGLFQLKVD